MIKAILIDDEVNCLSSLEILLNTHCPSVKILKKCQSSLDVLPLIASLDPDLLFLDIEMPIMNGFDLLEQIRNNPVSVIFTTAFNQYAIQAIRYSALDYLLKPIDPKELVQSIQRFESQESKPSFEQFQFLIDKISQKEYTHKKLAIPNLEGFKMISIDNIVYCEADDNYTYIILKDDTKIIACRTLKEIQRLLDDYDIFIRVHHSFLINLNEVLQYVRGDGGYVMMSDGSHINVSRNKKKNLLRYLK
jgi:two-component system LytT family response regulator